MAKANEIKINQNVKTAPVTSNNNSHNVASNIPVADPNQYQSKKANPIPEFKQGTPLWKDIINAIPSYSKEDIAKASETAKTPMGVFKNATPEVKPVNAVEETAGGWNYGLDRSNGEQGQVNALVGSGHVVGMPQGQDVSLNLPQTQQGERIQGRTSIMGNLSKPTVVNGTNAQPVTSTSVGGQKTTVQPTNTTTQTQQQERIVTPDEFGNGDKVVEEQQWQNDTAYNNSVMQNMQNDLNQSTVGQLYGKIGTDYDSTVNTLQDANSVYAISAQERINTVKTMLSQDPYNIASSIANGDSFYNDMAMRDLMQYAPDRYKQIQEEVKKIQAGETANAISTDSTYPNITGTATKNTNNGVNSWAEGLSSSPLQTSQTIQKLTNAMANNQVANTATQEMLNINSQLAEYEEKMNNLEREAMKSFKSDVPDYLVKARMNNLRQQYQSEINKLESRYNSALDLYKMELNNAQRKEEMNLKYLQYQQGVNNDNWTRYYQSQQLKMNSIKWVDGKAYQMNGDGTITQLSDSTAYMNYQSDVNSALQGYMSIYTSGGATKTANGYKYNVSGGQCETFTDNFTEATTGLRMTGEGGRGWTTAEEKMGYINSMVPEVGSVAVAVGGAYDSKYGHTMLVTGYDASTGIVDLLWSNKDGDEMVYSTTAKLSDLYNRGLQGFWNPYKDVVTQNASMGNYMYSGFNTPMASAFERIASDSSLSATQRNALPIALEMYDTLYEIANNGQLDALVESGDLALIMNDFKNKKFSNADKGEKFLDAFTKALNNKAARLAGGEDSYLALMALQRIIEAKLRDESGAAISSSEWATNFSYLLPQAGESDYVKQGKLDAWDRIISTKFMTAGGKMSEYVPIFDVSTVREIW